MTDASATAEVDDEPERPVRPSGPPRWLAIALGVVAIAVLAFAIGRFTTFGVTAQIAAPTTDSADAGFARDMQVHHAQAVDMAMTLYRTTDDPVLRAMAYDMATAQSSQIGEMYSWLVAWGLPQSGGAMMSWMHAADGDHGAHESSAPALTDDEARAAMGMATDAQLAAFAAADGLEADCMFLELMTRHHVGAIEMVDAVLELGDQPRVAQVAQSMKDAQTFELESMAASQLRLGCTG